MAEWHAHGVSGSAGLAKSVLESLQPDPSPYIRSLSPARFLPRDWTWESARVRAELIYETLYELAAAAQGGPGRSRPGRFPDA